MTANLSANLLNKSYITDYFLDGYYLKSEATVQSQYPTVEEHIQIVLPHQSHPILVQVMEIVEVSEDEYKIYLVTV
ncbi:hypothetical protein [Synechocystis sp. LKSZ1]|uniref:hypothetical protein n=1 Tax=Synechocystis sp. LKSZ1 TaxID=3144951 RepID=UPI00336BCFC6